jgi:hypothetical protein
MIAFATLLVGSGLVINVADNVPRYDMKPTCRAAVAMMGNQGRTVESCMSGEERARKDLEKDWSKYPSAERTQCAAPMANNRSPSYVELLICLEMMGDSRKHRDEEQAAYNGHVWKHSGYRTRRIGAVMLLAENDPEQKAWTEAFLNGLQEAGCS